MEKAAIILTVAPILIAVIVLLNKFISHTDTEIMWESAKEAPIAYTTNDKGLTIFDEYMDRITIEKEECDRMFLKHALLSFLLFRR